PDKTLEVSDASLKSRMASVYLGTEARWAPSPLHMDLAKESKTGGWHVWPPDPTGTSYYLSPDGTAYREEKNGKVTMWQSGSAQDLLEALQGEPFTVAKGAPVEL